MHLATHPLPIATRWFALTAFVLSLGLAASAHAQSWTETGDAGDLPATAQSTAGNGALASVDGTLSSDADIDMYCIRITDPANFFAHLLCSGITDKNLFLFNAAGNGVSQGDGCAFSQTRITNSFVGPAGVYYLAITGEYALANNSLNSPIWTLGPINGERAPDGPGAPGPINNWGGNRLVNLPLGYSVLLNGATFCDAATAARRTGWGSLKLLYR